MKLQCNSCDGIYNSLDIHFTNACCNVCPYCIDASNRSQKKDCKPNVEAIVSTIIQNQDNVEDVLFLGGEPCIYLKELLDCVQKVKSKTKLKVYVTTSVPYACYTNKEEFNELLEIVDGLNISAQHCDESIADKLRGNPSKFDRQEFYNSLHFKEKIRININLVRHYLDTKQDIIRCLNHYDKMRFGGIMLRELQHSPEYFVSFEQAMGIKLPSPYANGCQTNIKVPNEKFETPIILKRSCSLVENSLTESWDDVLKSFIKIFKAHPGNKFGVIWEDGSFTERW